MDVNRKKQLMKRKSATLMLDDVVYTIVASTSKPSKSDSAAVHPSSSSLQPEAESVGGTAAVVPGSEGPEAGPEGPDTGFSVPDTGNNVLADSDNVKKDEGGEMDGEKTKSAESCDAAQHDVKERAIHRLRMVLITAGASLTEAVCNDIGYAISVLESLRISERSHSIGDVTRHTPPPEVDMASDGSDSISLTQSTPAHCVIADDSDQKIPNQIKDVTAAGAGDDDAGDEEVREFAEVQQQVPAEVREWLATTFTRQSALLKRRGNGQVKFRTVANVIRMGLMVEKLSRRTSTVSLIDIPAPVSSAMRRLDTWDFDVFNLSELSCGQPLRYLGQELFVRYGLLDKFKISPSRLDMFLQTVERGYGKHSNPYHNALHACDVTQTAHHILSRMGLMQFLTHLELMSLLLAAIIHDVEHTGTTNNFHVNSGSDTALIYNDKSVLENHHVSTAFRIMRNDECNILGSLSRDEFTELRSLTIDMVLATDMSTHSAQIKSMKHYTVSSETVADKSRVLSLVLHCCDISHPSKDWRLHHRWTSLLLEEFFLQGDEERRLDLPISPLCDRTSTLVPQSQIGFIEFIVEPSLAVCGDLLDRIYLYLHEGPDTVAQDNNQSGKYPWKQRPWDQCLATNKTRWTQQKEDHEASLRMSNNEGGAS